MDTNILTIDETDLIGDISKLEGYTSIVTEGMLGFYKRYPKEEIKSYSYHNSDKQENQEYVHLLENWLDYLPKSITSLKINYLDPQCMDLIVLDDKFIDALPRRLKHLDLGCYNLCSDGIWPDLVSLIITPHTKVTAEFLKNLPPSLTYLEIHLDRIHPGMRIDRETRYEFWTLKSEHVDAPGPNLRTLKLVNFYIDDLPQLQSVKLKRLISEN
jgi:hypothetical protein